MVGLTCACLNVGHCKGSLMRTNSRLSRIISYAFLGLAIAGSAIAAPCTDEDYYWCNYYRSQCLVDGGDAGQCESAYITCLVSVGCTPP